MSSDESRREAATAWLLDRVANAEAGNPPVTPLDLGWLGRVFGARCAANNIAGTTVVAAILLLFLIWYLDGERPSSGQMVTGAFSLVSLALGYLFGASGNRV